MIGKIRKFGKLANVHCDLCCDAYGGVPWCTSYDINKTAIESAHTKKYHNSHSNWRPKYMF